MAKWTVKKFVKSNGRCPIEEWLESKKVTAKDCAAMDGLIQAIELTNTNAMFPPEKVKKYHGTELHELKVRAPGKQLRPLAQVDGSNKQLILFWGSIEKDGSLDGGDVTKAENLAADWKARRGILRGYWED